jgi:uncharacterized OsmC-like protein
VPSPRAKVLDFSLALDSAGRVSVEGAPAVPLPQGLTPEHLLLAALLRCSLASLAYHARRAGSEPQLERASASGRVTRREEDGRYALVAIDCLLAVSLQPPVPSQELPDLLAKTERDCFVGASLAVRPRYLWRVDGREAQAAPLP